MSKRAKGFTVGVALLATVLSTGQASAATVAWTYNSAWSSLTDCNATGQRSFDNGGIADWICAPIGGGAYGLWVTWQGPSARGYELENVETSREAGTDYSTADNTQVLLFQLGNNLGLQWGLQHWSNGTVSLFTMTNDSSCMDIHNSNNAYQGDYVVIYHCTGQASQSWKVLPGNYSNSVQFQSVKYPQWCLSTAIQPLQVNVEPCNNAESNWKLQDN